MDPVNLGSLGRGVHATSPRNRVASKARGGAGGRLPEETPMTENEQRPFSSVCDAVRSQADSMLMLADAMAREARQQASSLERVLCWLDEESLKSGGMKQRPPIKSAIAFLRDIGGPHECILVDQGHAQ